MVSMKCIDFDLTKLFLLTVYFAIQVSAFSASWCASPSHRFHFQCLFHNPRLPAPTARPHFPQRPAFHTRFQPSRAPRTSIQRLRMTVRPSRRSRFRNARPTHVTANFRPAHLAPNLSPFDRRFTTRHPSSTSRQPPAFRHPVHPSKRVPVQRPHFHQPTQTPSRPHFRQPVQSAAFRAPVSQNQFRQPSRAPSTNVRQPVQSAALRAPVSQNQFRQPTRAPARNVRQPAVASPDFSRNGLLSDQTNRQEVTGGTTQRTNAAAIPRIRQQLRTMISQDSSRIALWVRLGFHTCVGGCDGCLHLGDVSNRGLNTTYRRLQEVHSNHAADISLADLIALAAVEAANQGMSSSSSGVEIPIRFGRRTCSNIERPSKRQIFPKGEDPRALEVMMAEFGLTRRQAIALLGAHSLGRCRRQNSGFVGPWDNTPTRLDSGYYRSLVGTSWQTAVSPGGKVQWTGNPDNLNSRMMLNADMAIFKQFTVQGPQSQPSCSNMTSCPNAPRNDQDLVRQYATDERTFHNDFRTAYVKMLEKTDGTLFTI